MFSSTKVRVQFTCRLERKVIDPGAGRGGQAPGPCQDDPALLIQWRQVDRCLAFPQGRQTATSRLPVANLSEAG